MKFLLDMNLPRMLCVATQQMGHPCWHVAEFGLADAPDEQVVQEARQSGEIILTHDLDYSRILAFSGESQPSVIIFRVSKPSLSVLTQRLQETLQLAADDLERGAIVSMEDQSVRIRRLPVRS